MAEDRISKLSQRFRTHAVGRKPTSPRARERQSFYLDADLVGRLDKTYKDLNHELYPDTVTKAGFLEGLLEYGLEHLAEVKVVLSQGSESAE
jgi:hypothetical protein